MIPLRFRCRSGYALFKNSLLYRADFTTSSSGSTCWKCGGNVSTYELFCAAKACGAVQPRKSQELDFFDLFGIEKRSIHDIDIDRVGWKFKELQKLLHPDKFSMHSQEEQAASTMTSSAVNQVSGYQKENIPHSFRFIAHTESYLGI